MRTRVAWPSRRRQVQSGVPQARLIPVVPILLPLLPIVFRGSSSAGQPACVRAMSTAPAVRPSHQFSTHAPGFHTATRARNHGMSGA